MRDEVGLLVYFYRDEGNKSLGFQVKKEKYTKLSWGMGAHLELCREEKKYP
jgi:hypothetical protein